MPSDAFTRPSGIASHKAALIAIAAAFAASSLALIVGLASLEASEKAVEVRQDLRQHTKVVATALSQPLWTLNQDQATRVLSGLSASPSFRAAWVEDDRGVRFAEAGSLPQDASSTLRETVDVVAPFEERGRRIGAVTVAYGVSAIAEARRHVFIRFGVAAFALLAVVVVASTLLIRRFVRPLSAVTDGLLRIADGELATPPPHRERPDEIGALAIAVETLRQQAIIARDATEALRSARDDLALQVEARTAALAESEQRFADFAQAGGDWLWEMDSGLRFTYFSDNVKRIVGVDPEWHYGKTRRDLLGTNYDRGAWDEHLRTLEEHKPFRDFVYRRVGDGIEPRWLRTSGIPVFGDDGAFLGYRGTASDVTRELEAVAALKVVMDAVPTFISVEDAEGRYVMLNRFAADFMGVATERAIGRTVWQALPEALASALSARGRTVVESGTSSGFFDLLLTGSDGMERHWLAVKVPHFDGAGRVQWVITVATDITEQKLIEARLAKIADRLRRQSEALDELTRHEAVARGDTAELFRAATETLVHVLGVARASVWRMEDGARALACIDVFSAGRGHDRGARLSASSDPTYFDALKRGRTINADDPRDHAPIRELRRSDPLGQEISTVLAVPIRLGGETRGVVYGEQVGSLREWDNDERGFCIAVADLLALSLEADERRAAEARLRQAHKMEAVGQLTGGIAHDFNNLLSVILGNLEMLAELSAGNAEQTVRITRVIRAAERGAGLVRQLLAFSRRQALDPRPIDVSEMIGRMRELLSRTLGEKIDIQARVAADVWTCRADPGQLEAALLNLAVNARDAMPDGGVLSIEARNAELEGRDLNGVADAGPGDFVRLSIVDSGHGMSPGVVARAFEPFFTTKPVGRGSGLGLSMVDGFVRQSGGHVQIESEVGRGTAVHLHIPRDLTVRGSETSAPSSRAPVAAAEHAGKRILVVEDSAPLREVACSMLASLGYDVVAAADGHEALAILNADQDIDLIFTDVVMPGGIDGVELVRRARGRRPGFKAILTSGYSEVTASRANDPSLPIVSKPYRKSDLASVILRVFADEGDLRPHARTVVRNYR